MPNWVTNRLYVSGEGVSLEDLTANGGFTFNKFVPMPAELKDVSAFGDLEELVSVYIKGLLGDEKAFETIPDNCMDNVKLAHFCLTNYGYTDWYNWRIANWGTKWDLSNPIMSNEICEDEKGKYIEFDTAWSTPEDFFATLSKKYPKAEFFIKYADEDWGRNAGAYLVINGAISDLSYDPSEVATEILGPREEYYGEE